MARTMRAVVFDSPNRVALKQVPYPQPAPDQVVVRVMACGLCGTDRHLYHGDFPAHYPLIPGHEFSGTIAQVGSAVMNWHVGDRVIVDPNIACGECYFCRNAQINHCLNHAAMGVTQDGAFAEFVAAPAHNVYAIGNDLSFAEAAMVEPLSCVVYGMRRLQLLNGDTVLIFGAGPIGLMLMQCCKHGGASSVTIVDTDDQRLAMARPLGATWAINVREQNAWLTEIAPYGFAAVIDATGVPSVVESSVPRVKSGGKLLLFGVCPEDAKISISPFEIYRRDLSVIGTFALRYSFDPALELIRNGVVQVKPLLRPMLSLDEIPALFEDPARTQGALKILFCETPA
jgi:2-desacetyl-2-hydroxyethyl bacteriochlorophyllide A dehydrogenase